MGWILFIKILPTLNGLNLYHKGIQCMVDFWDDEQMDLFKWDRALEKFNLTTTEAGDWTELTGKTFGQW